MECVLKQCDNKQRGGGYCKRHYHSYVFLKRYPLYNTWTNIKRRCRDKKFPRYPEWGGRGIDICDEWFDSYSAFERYVGKKPSPFHQLDRIDNQGNYEPGNVRWATATVQARNRRTKAESQSGAKGIETRAGGTFVARITVNKRRINLGTFYTLTDAIAARSNAEELYF